MDNKQSIDSFIWFLIIVFVIIVASIFYMIYSGELCIKNCQTDKKPYFTPEGYQEEMLEQQERRWY